MKALIYTAPETLEYQSTEPPQASEGEQLIRVAHAGICGSDMHAYLGHDDRRPAPLILGHEASGVIVGGARDGERVAINPLVTCGSCVYCRSARENLCPQRQIISMPPREGAFAEWVAMPESNLLSVPETASLAHVALTEPLSCGWHAVRRACEASHCAPEDIQALVLGGGAIGMGGALALKAQGIHNITMVEANPLRQGFLLRHCEHDVIAPEKLPNSPHFDVVIDAVGFAATRQCASAMAKPGGVIVHIGLGEDTGGLDIRRMTLQEITFIGTYTFTPLDFQHTAHAIFDGQLGPLDWVENRALSEGAKAFADIRQGRVGAPKVLLTPD